MLSKKEEAIAKLNKNRENKLVKFDQHFEAEILGQCQIGKKDSRYFQPYLTLMQITSEEKEFEYYVITHFGIIPNARKVKMDREGVDWKATKVLMEEVCTLQDGIDKIKQYGAEYHLNSYSFLVGWCLSRRLDLIESGVLDK